MSKLPNFWRPCLAAAHWEKRADSGNVVTRAFCPTCGSPVYSLNSGMPELSFVKAASLDDPSRYVPQMVVFTASGFGWTPNRCKRR